MVVVVAPLEIKENIVTGAGELGCPLIYSSVRPRTHGRAALQMSES